MIIYSVNIAIERSVESEWLEWMSRVHVPDVLRTGCFIEARIFRVLENGAEEAKYAIQYHCRSLEQYEQYRDNFAPALQKAHSERFGGRFRASRQLLEEVASFPPGAT
ncbi:MAG TPA: DUF4286 family protein [Chthoniobacterales bacterium]|nr:DUF4286 family protein [Chthoniobacterales bacterium]